MCSVVSKCRVCVYSVLSYAKRLIKIIKHKEEQEEDIYARWEKDFDLAPNSVHGLFYEYLELGVFIPCLTLLMYIHDKLHSSTFDPIPIQSCRTVCATNNFVHPYMCNDCTLLGTDTCICYVAGV